MLARSLLSPVSSWRADSYMPDVTYIHCACLTGPLPNISSLHEVNLHQQAFDSGLVGDTEGFMYKTQSDDLLSHSSSIPLKRCSTFSRPKLVMWSDSHIKWHNLHPHMLPVLFALLCGMQANGVSTCKAVLM